MRRFGCRTRVVASTLLLTRPKLRGVRPRAVSNPSPLNQLESAARGKASVASERLPEGGHAASRQLHYPNPHPASLPQPTSGGVASRNCAGSDPAQFQTRPSRSRRRRGVKPPWRLNGPQREGMPRRGSFNTPTHTHLHYPKQHPASLPQATPSFATPSHIQRGCANPHPRRGCQVPAAQTRPPPTQDALEDDRSDDVPQKGMKMVDFAKKVQKKGAEMLLPGETVLAAAPMQPVGSFGKQVSMGAIGGLAGAAIGSRMGRNDDGSVAVGTMAESFPGGNLILAVTDQRVIAFEQSPMGGNPKAIGGEWQRDQVAELTLEKKKMTYLAEMKFADGSVATGEMVRAAKPDKVAAVING